MLQTRNIEELSRTSFVEPAPQAYTTGYKKTDAGSNTSMADKPNEPPSGQPIVGSAAPGNRELDQVLVERAQQGDKKAFGMLVEKYHRKLGR